MPLRKIRAERANVRESDIISALALSNRHVTLAMLASWRRRGLLPAFDREGAPGGQRFFWKDAAVIERAKYVFDALSQECPFGEIYIGLWIAGFDVPIHIFRRSWRSWLRTQNRWKLNRSAQPPAKTFPTEGSTVETSPLQLLAKSLITVDGFASFETALNSMTRALFGNSDPFRPETLMLIRSLTLALESSDLLESTSDQALQRAQRYLANILAAFKCSIALGEGERALPAVWPVSLSIQIGSPLLWMILSLIYSGHEERLAASNTALAELTGAAEISKPKSSEELLRRARVRLTQVWRPLLCDVLLGLTALQQVDGSVLSAI
jgi:hypothetical protein